MLIKCRLIRSVRQKPGKPIRHLRRAADSLVAVFRHHRADNGRQFFRNIIPKLRERRRCFFLMSHQPLHQSPLGERRLSGQQEIERAAQTVDVGSSVDSVTVGRLFGSEIIGRPENSFVEVARQIFLAVKFLRQSEIQNSDQTVACHKQIAGLDVTMHHAGLVSKLKAMCGLANGFCRLTAGQWTVGVDDLEKIAAAQEFHRHEVNGILSV